MVEPSIEGAWLEAIDEVLSRALPKATVRHDALVGAVRQVSQGYTRERAALRGMSRGEAALAARLAFFLPRDLPKIALPLSELARAGCLPAARRWRVLDVGAGLGASSLGVARHAAREGVCDGLDVTACDDDSSALRLFSQLAERTQAQSMRGVSVPVSLRTSPLDASSESALTALGGPFELIVLGFVVNELFTSLDPSARRARITALLVKLTGALTPDGALIVLEPALKETSRALQAVRDELAARSSAPYVFAPCLTHAPCPMLRGERDWCHDEVPAALPARLAELARGAGLRAEDLTFSHLTLRSAPAGLPGDLRVVSAPLASKGKLERIGCTRAGDLVRLVRLDRHASAANSAIEEVSRGELLTLTDASEKAPGSLRIDEATRVERARR